MPGELESAPETDVGPETGSKKDKGGESFDICAKCNKKCRYLDDSHDDCMRCRGKSHLCELCPKMGPKAKDRFLEWSRTSSQQSKVPESSQKFLTQEDLSSFGKNLAESMANSMQNVFMQLIPTIPKVVPAVGSTSRSLRTGGPAVGPNLPSEARVETTRAVGTTVSTNAAQVEIEIDTPEGQFDDEDIESVCSERSWDNKRKKRDDDDEIDDDDEQLETDSCLDPRDKAEGAALSQSENEKYVNTIAKMISVLDISEAKIDKASSGKIKSSRAKSAKPRALLPFDSSHREAVDKIWKSDVNDICTYKKATKDRYKVIPTDYDKYLKFADLNDDYLMVGLEKNDVKTHVKKPKLKDKKLTAIENKAKHIEVQAQIGMACAVTQSWLTQYMAEQIEKIESVLEASLEPKDFQAITERIDFETIKDVASISQDACLDQLDLQARETAVAKGIRRSMWVQETSWHEAIKAKIQKLPTVGDGSMCGPQLPKILEAYRTTKKATDAAETVQSAGRGKRGRGRGRGGGPPAKTMRLDLSRINFGRGDRGFRRGGRGGPRGGSSGSRTVVNTQANSGNYQG